MHNKRLFSCLSVTLVVSSICLVLLSSCTASKIETQDPTTEALALYQDAETRPLVMAYYYIWFDPTSWHRAKTDYPLLGNYSSFDRTSMRKHIRWAKAAGIDAFIISWKSSDKLNERLESIINIAQDEDFKLALLYQGLDFEREAISADKVAVDLDYFIEKYKDHPVFSIYDKPLTVWAGTWKFSYEEIEDVTRSRREDLLILSSERNIDGYERVADLVDGNAYYWGALNPDTYPNYPGKLIEMSERIHSRGGIWVAPAAPGFDARLVGGTSVVERLDGEMFRRQMAGAVQSSPDVVGIISWNEFSENSHIEPSTRFETQYIEELAQILGADLKALNSALVFPQRRPAVSLIHGLPLIVAVVGLFAVSIYKLLARSTNAERSSSSDAYQTAVQNKRAG